MKFGHRTHEHLSQMRSRLQPPTGNFRRQSRYVAPHPLDSLESQVRGGPVRPEPTGEAEGRSNRHSGVMVRRCLAWQREGLGMPPAVKVATAKYLESTLGSSLKNAACWPRRKRSLVRHSGTATRSGLSKTKAIRFRRRSSPKSWKVRV